MTESTTAALALKGAALRHYKTSMEGRAARDNARRGDERLSSANNIKHLATSPNEEGNSRFLNSRRNGSVSSLSTSRSGGGEAKWTSWSDLRRGEVNDVLSLAFKRVTLGQTCQWLHLLLLLYLHFFFTLIFRPSLSAAAI